MTTRRHFMRAGGAALAGLALPSWWRVPLPSEVVEISMRSDQSGSRVWFDPVGVLVEPGTTIRWVAV